MEPPPANGNKLNGRIVAAAAKNSTLRRTNLPRIRSNGWGDPDCSDDPKGNRVQPSQDRPRAKLRLERPWVHDPQQAISPSHADMPTAAATPQR
jgi:hypothetical protein